jgi:ACT domain-containing protein
MTTKTIFNMDAKLKKAAMRKTREEGITLTSFLNFATREYVKGNLIGPSILREIYEAQREIDRGNYVTHEELVKSLQKISCKK